MKRLCLFFVVLLTFGVGAEAQKAYRPLRDAVKNKSGIDAALKTADQLSKEERYKNDPELYQLSLQLYVRQNEAENEKAYLKQKYDTARFFSSIYGIYDQAFKVDELERLPDKHGKIKFKFRPRNVELLKRFYRNLLNAVPFYLQRNKFAEAEKYANLILQSSRQPMLATSSRFHDTLVLARTAYRAAVAAYAQKAGDRFLTFVPLALTDTAFREQIMEMQCEVLAAQGDTLAMVDVLKQGVRLYPASRYFFPHLIDYYNAHAYWREALSVADTLQSLGDTTRLVAYARALALLALGHEEQSLVAAAGVLKKDSTYADAWIIEGTIYLDRARRLERELSKAGSIKGLAELKKRIREQYAAARYPYEAYRKLRPNDVSAWGPPLYRIYLNLNNEKGFNEIDKLLSKKK